MTIHYEAKDYPCAPKLTRKSKRIGYLTCGTFVTFVYGSFIMIVGNGILMSLNVKEDVAMWLSVAAVVAVYFLLKNVRKKAFAKMDKQYMEELRKWQEADPEKYAEAVRLLQQR